METDIPLTHLFACPFCGFRASLTVERVVLVKCICGHEWVHGDWTDYLSLPVAEKKKIKFWDITFYRDQRELNDAWFGGASVRS